MSPEHMAVVAAVVGPPLLGILMWSLRRNILDLDKRVDRLENRIEGLEERERANDVNCARRHPDDP